MNQTLFLALTATYSGSRVLHASQPLHIYKVL